MHSRQVVSYHHSIPLVLVEEKLGTSQHGVVSPPCSISGSLTTLGDIQLLTQNTMTLDLGEREGGGRERGRERERERGERERERES